MSDQEYYERFKALDEVILIAGGHIGQHPALIKVYNDVGQGDNNATKSDLHNQHTRGSGKYPKDLISVYELMTIYDIAQNKRMIGVKMENEGVTFITKEQKDKV